MDWKEFFKPNKWKVIIAFLLLVIGLWIGLSIQNKYFCKCSDPPECTGCPKMPITFQVITWILLLPVIPGMLVLESSEILGLCIVVILSVVYYYLISCALIYMYLRVKK